MANCIYCGAETNLYHADRAICIECDVLTEARKPPRKPPPDETAPAEPQHSDPG